MYQIYDGIWNNNKNNKTMNQLNKFYMFQL